MAHLRDGDSGHAPNTYSTTGLVSVGSTAEAVTSFSSSSAGNSPPLRISEIEDDASYQA